MLYVEVFRVKTTLLSLTMPLKAVRLLRVRVN